MLVRRLGFAFGGTVAAIVLWLLFPGSVSLFDPYGEVTSADIVDGWGKRQRLTDLRFAFVGVPHLEGTVEIKCSDGKVIRSGYVTPGVPTWQRMGQQGECSTR